MNTTRRRLLRGLCVAAAAATGPAVAAMLTPRQPAGPFYPVDLPLDQDADLVNVAGQPAPARGRVSDLYGRLLDADGRPLAGLRVEIWQCDANGRYRHPHDRGGAAPDPGFQGFGHALSDADGRYRFRTIRPVPYPGRTPHIHVAVHRPDEGAFVTQLYVAGEPGNGEDFLYRRIPPEQRELVTAAFAETTPGQPLQARWDIVLGVAPGG